MLQISYYVTDFFVMLRKLFHYVMLDFNPML